MLVLIKVGIPSSLIHPPTMVTMKPSESLISAQAWFILNKNSLAIARIFGGFPTSFFATYHSYFRKTEPVDEYPLRAELYELFHYLNHTILFGVGCINMNSLVQTEASLQGSYAVSTQSRIDTLLQHKWE